jgi:hypothetical protein
MAWRNKNISLSWLKAVISLVAVAAIAVRIAFPDIRIDLVTLGLMIVAILPWLSELIESAKFPGGWEVKFRDLREAGEKVTSSSEPSPTPSHQPPPAAQPEPSYVSVADQDPNLALVGLRIEIEQRIRQLSQRHDLPMNRVSLAKLIRELTRREVIPYGVASGLEDLVTAGNQAAHGASVDPRIADWAITTGPEILAALDALL